jgi:hypothetical protein
MELDDQGRIVLNLADTNPGLENSDGLRVKVTSPIARTASGVDLTLATDPGLEDVSGLRVKAVTPLERTADGLELSLAATGGLLTVDSGNLAFSYDDTQGLDQVAGEQTPVQEADLVAWWPFDDGSGTTVDESQNSNDGSLEGSFSGGDGSGWATDHPAASTVVTGSLDTAGASNIVSLGGDPVPAEFDIDPDGDNYSVCFWMKTTTDGGYIVAWTDVAGGTTNRGFAVQTSGDEIYVAVGGPYTVSDTAGAGLNPNDGSWHHIAATIDNSGGTAAIKIYMDGTEVGSGSSTGTQEGSFDWTMGGRRNTSNSDVATEWTGKLCDLRIYHTVLTATDVADIAAGTESDVPDLLVVDLAATNPGLEFDGSGDLQVKVKASSGLTVDSDGLQVTAATARADSSQNAITLTSVTDPADAPADADALRDDLVANALAELQTRDGELETAIETLAGEFNDLLSKLRTANLLDT